MSSVVGSVVIPPKLSFWDDISEPLIGQRLFTTPGTLDYNYDEGTVTASPSGDIASNSDRVIMVFQNSHASKTDAPLRFHVHWEQTDATERAFTWQYRVQGNGQAKTTAWSTPVTVTSTTGNAFPYTSGTLNQITDLGEISTTDKGLSSPVQIRWTRSDANAGTIEVTFLDCHKNIDAFGSRQEFKK